MEWRVSLSDLDYGEAEQQAVLEVLQRKWLTMGAVTQEFEARFAAQIGAKHALAVTNATVALHLACEVVGLREGTEAIAPSLSFVATSNAILYTGAEVRFADILGPQDLTIDPAAIEAAITPRTRAIMVMHYGGYACQMPAIMALAAKYGLAVIEDAAHAPDAWLEGRALGTWGDVACFSFFSNKNLSTGEGGMIVTNRDDLAERLRLLRSHGMTSLTWDRHHGRAHSYDVTALGYNYRIDEIHSALGLVQLAKLAANNQRRAILTGAYREKLADTPLELPFAQTDGQSAHHIMPVLLPENCDRDGFMEAMKAQGVQTSIHYPPIHTFTYYRQRCPDVHLPRTEVAAARELTVPLYPSMSMADLDYVAHAVHQALASGA